MENFSSIIQEDIETIIQKPITWEQLYNKTILITGANGLIASYLIYTLLYLNDKKKANITVIGLARNYSKLKNKYGKLLERLDFHYVIQDVTTPISFSEKVNYIIHAASQTGPNQFINDPVGTAVGNMIGTFELLEYAKEHQIEGFLLLSTREIYGAGTKDFVSENDYGILNHTLVRSCYPESKKMAENLCACYREQYNLSCKVVRIAHTYGPGMLLSDGRVVGDFLGNAVRGENIILNSDGSGSLALTYISDVISGIYKVICNLDDFVFNISNSKEPILVRELAMLICSLFPEKKITAEFHSIENSKKNGYLNVKLGFLDSSKLESHGWIPEISLSDGIIRTVHYYDQA